MMKKNNKKKKVISILLSEDVQHLGKRNSVSKVKPGYASNFLVPKKKAVYANEEILLQFNIKKEEEILRLKEIKEKAYNLKKEIEKVSIFEVKKRLKDNEKTFSKVTKKQIISVVLKTINEKSTDLNLIDIIHLPEIRKKDDYNISLKLHKEIEAAIVVRIIPE